MHAWAFRNRHKLSALIDDVWSWEEVGKSLELVSGTRVERLCAAAGEVCLCSGQWPFWANQALALNCTDAGFFWHTLYMALHDGRREDKTVMVSVGKRGGPPLSSHVSPCTAAGQGVRVPR